MRTLANILETPRFFRDDSEVQDLIALSQGQDNSIATATEALSKEPELNILNESSKVVMPNSSASTQSAKVNKMDAYAFTEADTALGLTVSIPVNTLVEDVFVVMDSTASPGVLIDVKNGTEEILSNIPADNLGVSSVAYMKRFSSGGTISLSFKNSNIKAFSGLLYIRRSSL